MIGQTVKWNGAIVTIKDKIKVPVPNSNNASMTAYVGIREDGAVVTMNPLNIKAISDEGEGTKKEDKS